MTKKQQGFYESYLYAVRHGRKTELWEVYGRFSYAKQRALDYCKQLQAKFDGTDGTIVGHNSSFFTYAFRFWDNGVEHLAYITANNNYIFPVE